MRWTDLLRMSAQNLWRRKLRTILTMVGVMIGTASIVVMVSLGIGINQGYIDSLSETGELTRIQISSQLYWSSNNNAVVYLDDETTVKAQKLDDTMIRKISRPWTMWNPFRPTCPSTTFRCAPASCKAITACWPSTAARSRP